MRSTCATLLTFFLVACGGGSGGGGGGGGGTGKLSDDATLAFLAPSAGTMVPSFDPQTTTYSVDVPESTMDVYLFAEANHEAATVEVDGFVVEPGFPTSPVSLEWGVPRPIVVEVTAEDGTVLVYTVVVTRAQARPFYLKASNTDPDDQFGRAVSVFGNTLVVGAPAEDGSGIGVDAADDDLAEWAGAAYVFVRSGDTWVFEAYLKASNTGPGDLFGTSVAVHFDTIVVGAPGEAGSGAGVDPPDDDLLEGSGAAYVFKRAFGSWSQQAYLKAPTNTFLFAGFGQSVSVSADTVVVGSPLDSAVAGAEGAAYVFHRTGNTWSPQAQLRASNMDHDDRFGSSVCVQLDTIVVGAPREDGGSTATGGHPDLDDLTDAGAAYVFVRAGSTWTQQAYLKAPNADAFDQFGVAVAVSVNTIVVGADAEAGSGTGVDAPDDDAAPSRGAAYVFVRSGATWSPQAYLKASNEPLSFGESVAIYGDRIVVGAPGENGSGTGIDPPSDGSAPGSGAVYEFVRAGGVWTQSAYVKASNTGAGDRFGASVSVAESTIVAGAPEEDGSGTGVDPPDDDLAPEAGAAYVVR
jgi:hypothetical protein